MKGGKSKADTSKKSDTKLSVKRKGSKAPQKPSKREKAEKDPNKPKRPPSAFFVFMEEFRKSYKEKNPNVNKVAVIGKAGGEKWKSMSTAEKAPYEAKAAKLKTEYNKKMDAYNNQSESGNNGADDEEEASDKSKSEVNDEDNEDEEEESGEDEDDDE
ncbi:putative chromatin remodeling & transcriptional activation HMG family [Dioscorea sansibarensis]